MFREKIEIFKIIFYAYLRTFKSCEPTGIQELLKAVLISPAKDHASQVENFRTNDSLNVSLSSFMAMV